MIGTLLPGTQDKRVRCTDGKISVDEGAALQVLTEGRSSATLQAQDAAGQQTQIVNFPASVGDGESIILPLMEGAASR